MFHGQNMYELSRITIQNYASKMCQGVLHKPVQGRPGTFSGAFLNRNQNFARTGTFRDFNPTKINRELSPFLMYKQGRPFVFAWTREFQKRKPQIYASLLVLIQMYIFVLSKKSQDPSHDRSHDQHMPQNHLTFRGSFLG